MLTHWPTDMTSIAWEWLEVDKASVQFWKFFAIFGVFNELKSHKGKMTPQWNSTSLVYIELKLFHANFQNGAILSTPLFEPLNYQKNFFILGATLDLPLMNMKNQNKSNVCQSLVLLVYFQKKKYCGYLDFTYLAFT